MSPERVGPCGRANGGAVAAVRVVGYGSFARKSRRSGTTPRRTRPAPSPSVHGGGQRRGPTARRVQRTGGAPPRTGRDRPEADLAVGPEQVGPADRGLVAE